MSMFKYKHFKSSTYKYRNGTSIGKNVFFILENGMLLPDNSNFLFLFLKVYCMCTECFVCMYVYRCRHACLIRRVHQTFRKWEIQIVVCHVYTGNQTQILFKEQQVFLTTDPFLQPLKFPFLSEQENYQKEIVECFQQFII